MNRPAPPPCILAAAAGHARAAIHASRTTLLLTGRAGPGRFSAMKKLFELLVCLLHPLAVVLIWIDLATRSDIGSGPKVAWAIFCLIPLVPFVYVLTGGDLW